MIWALAAVGIWVSGVIAGGIVAWWWQARIVAKLRQAVTRLTGLLTDVDPNRGLHIGVRIRIDSPAGVILEGDSDWLHMNAVAVNLEHGYQGDVFTTESIWHEFLTTHCGLRFMIAPMYLGDAPAEAQTSDL